MSDNPRRLGRYLLWDEIGTGGMASVRLARLQGQAGFGRTVAVKMLHPHVAKDAEFVAMLLDEARIASRVHHPNVVQVLDLVVTDTDVALVLDFVHGDSLARLWRNANRRVPTAIALRIVIDVLRGLHAAHDATAEDGSPLAIVHRDVSPQNILVGFDGAARVLDFGVAKAAGRMQTTEDGKVKGKIAYMAPEQLRGRDLDRRTDVFAAGIVLWELLACERLYVGEPGEVIGKVAEGTVPPLAGDVAPSLRDVAARALARSPDDRFASAEAMANALEAEGPATSTEVGRWASEVSPTLVTRSMRLVEIERGGAAASTDESAVISTSTTTEVPITGPPPPRRWRTALALAVALGIGFGLALAVRGSAKPDEPSIPATHTAELVASLVASAGPSSIPSASSAPLASAPIALASATALIAHRPPSIVRPPVKPTATCDPPYVVDAQGNKQYKRECLRQP